MKVELAQIYGSNYIKLTGGKGRKGYDEIILQIDEAEALWQELMVKCKEYRMRVIEEIRQ